MERALILLSWWKRQEDYAHAITYGEAEANRICNPCGYSARFFPAKSTGVMGDNGVYGFGIELKGPYNHNMLAELSSCITNEIRGINRVVYSIDK